MREKNVFPKQKTRFLDYTGSSLWNIAPSGHWKMAPLQRPTPHAKFQEADASFLKHSCRLSSEEVAFAYLLLQNFWNREIAICCQGKRLPSLRPPSHAIFQEADVPSGHWKRLPSP